MALRPLHNRIVVERSETTSEQKSAGGIIIPDSAKEKPQEATVVAVGPGKIDKDGKRQPMDVQVGDRILIGKYSGSDIKLDNKEYVILTEDEVLAVIEGSADKKKAA
jgi:chaperonin GroES